MELVRGAYLYCGGLGGCEILLRVLSMASDSTVLGLECRVLSERRVFCLPGIMAGWQRTESMKRCCRASCSGVI